MRELNIGGQTVRVRATAPALLYYKQAFKADLIGDLLKLTKVAEDLTNLDSILVLQIVWAMSKADSFGKEFPAFESWLAALESVDFSDPAFMAGALEEAADGFFRTGVKGGNRR